LVPFAWRRVEKATVAGFNLVLDDPYLPMTTAFYPRGVPVVSFLPAAAIITGLPTPRRS
jgi:hypothetical protein